MRTQLKLTALCTVVGVVAASHTASAQQLRYSTTTSGGILSTGNTLGLSKAFNQNGPGTLDSIGTFISLDPQSRDNDPFNPANPYPFGTTFDWTNNGSEGGPLNFDPDDTILYAELVWAGSYEYGDSVVANIDDPVTLSVGGNSIQVTPDPATAVTIAEQSFSGFAANYYIRSADVTQFVIANGGGAYAVSGVPATQTDTINSLNAAGWTLLVAYRGEGEPIRNLSVFVGGSFVDEDSSQDYTVSGFCAPPFGPVEGRAVVSTLEGDADLAGDDLAIGKSASDPFVFLSGPNNPQQNFFGSQINGRDGNINTSGSFGMVNHDPFTEVMVAGARQGWDLTTVDLSSVDGHLENAQTSAVLRTETSGDSYVPTAVALAIDVKAPEFEDSSTVAMPASVMMGETITVTATLKNTGEAAANNLLFVLPLEAGLKLINYSTDGAPGDADGNPVNAQGLIDGVPTGTLEVNMQTTIELTVEVIGTPAVGENFAFRPAWEHNFVTCDGEPPIPESVSPDPALVAYTEDVGGAGGATSVTSSSAGVGGGVTSSSSAGGNGVEPEMIEEDGGCGCSTPGREGDDAPPAGGLAALFGLVATAGARVRRRRR
ncbi:MAG: MYXO-CTERM sorting domain-containing protein [Myxococcota bacterium]